MARGRGAFNGGEGAGVGVSPDRTRRRYTPRPTFRSMAPLTHIGVIASLLKLYPAPPFPTKLVHHHDILLNRVALHTINTLCYIDSFTTFRLFFSFVNF